MAKIIDTPPDKIVKAVGGQYLFYFTGGQDSYKLPIGSEYVVVYSPGGSNGRWHATRFQVVPVKNSKVTAVQVVKERKLTAKEIAHFEGLIAEQG